MSSQGKNNIRKTPNIPGKLTNFLLRFTTHLTPQSPVSHFDQYPPKATTSIFSRSKMGTAGEAECALEMEAMRNEDSSWHPCRVSFWWGLRCSLCFP